MASPYDLRVPGAALPYEGAPPLKKKAPALTLPQAALLIKAVFPMRVFNKRYVLEILQYYQKRNFIAYRSHRKAKQEAEKARL